MSDENDKNETDLIGFLGRSGEIVNVEIFFKP